MKLSHLLSLFFVALALATELSAAAPDLILHNGKVVTVDAQFSIVTALAVRDGKIVAVGTDEQILPTKGEATRLVDLAGKMVLPGLIDSHVHAVSASMTEWDHPVPEMKSIADVLDYIRARAKIVPAGEWIVLSQVFITRLREQRYPTRAELDEAAPKHPVAFRTGPDASVNSLALKRSGIDRDFQVVGAGRVEKDPQTGEPTGILRNCGRYLKITRTGPKPTEAIRHERLRMLMQGYNAVGITAIADRSAGDSNMRRYRALASAGELHVRVAASRSFSAGGSREALRRRLETLAAEKKSTQKDLVRTVGVKIFLDGGMLTGSAYLREPWGVSEIYSITDPRYRGVRFVEQDQLELAVSETVRAGLQFTAHSVGDGAVHALLDAYHTVNQEMPIAATRPCITHCNFMSREAIETMARLGVVADIQPAWLYLDGATLTRQFGEPRLRYFQPLASLFEARVIVGGGSDHMQRIGPRRSLNPYDPFLGIWTTVTRNARWRDKPLHPHESLSREQAIRFYTRNNAYLIFREDEIGSLEPGKLDDMIVIDRDLLTCPPDAILETKVLATYFAGREVYRRAAQP